MMRSVPFTALFMLVIPAWAQNEPGLGSDALNSASTPYDLARFIDSHAAFDWAPLWKAMGVPSPPKMLSCDRENVCAVDIVTAFKPSQAILVVERRPEATYLRFIENNGRWQYAGAHQTNTKNHPGRHEIMRMKEKTFLKISGQGASGSDVDSEIEYWLDLSLPDFEPVFSFTVQGTEDRHESGVSRSIHAAVNPGRVDETLELDLEIQYFGFADLGSTTFRATFERPADQRDFAFRNSDPELSQKDFLELANIDGTSTGPSNEQLLTYTLSRLAEIATGTDAEAKEWLKFMLGNCKDTPEKRTLEALLRRAQ